MKSFRTPFEMEVDVTFEDPEKAEAYFIKGTDWKSYFWIVFDLSELAEHISDGFHHEREQWNKELKTFTKFIEGFGEFIKNDNGTWRNSEEAAKEWGGHISIKYDTELTVGNAFELVKGGTCYDCR